MDYLLQRNGWFHYYRKVPIEIRHLEKRRHVRIALKTKDPIEAARRALIQNDAIEKYWRSLIIAPDPEKSEARYHEAVATARSYGFAYKSIADIAAGPLEDLVERLQAVKASSNGRKDAPALLGRVDVPKQRLSGAIETFFTLNADRLVGKSDLFVRKWKNPRRKAIENFIAAVGDKAIAAVTARDILDFRKWWQEKAIKEGLDPVSGNKDFMHLKAFMKTMVRELELGEVIDVGSYFTELSFRGAKRSREPFDATFVQNVILKPGALDQLNIEARAIVYMMADTGARVAEITGLRPEDIILDADIPHIWIRANEIRTLKTPQSDRQIPLVGSALYAARLVPQGFPRYAGRESASNLINAFFDDNKMKPSRDHTLYSLRHTFKDRLRDKLTPEEIVDGLMGHSHRGPKYGRGHLLKTRYEWLQKIAFKAPQ